MLRFIVGGPFISETSVKMSTYLIPIAIVMFSYVLKNYDLENHKKWLFITSLFFLMIGIIQIIMVYFINIKSGKGFIWTEGIASIVPIIGLLLYLKTQKKF